MCKTWCIKYQCSHAFKFRLSTCGGTFTTQTKPTRDPKAMCCTAPIFVMQSTSSCGPCQCGKIELGVEEKINGLRRGPEWLGKDELADSIEEGAVVYQAREAALAKEASSLSSQLAEAIEEQAALQFRLGKMYPSTQALKEYRCPEKGRRATGTAASPLTREVKIEDVVTKDDDNDSAEVDADSSWYENWAAGWTADTSSANAWDLNEWAEVEPIQDDFATAEDEDGAWQGPEPNHMTVVEDEFVFQPFDPQHRVKEPEPTSSGVDSIASVLDQCRYQSQHPLLPPSIPVTEERHLHGPVQMMHHAQKENAVPPHSTEAAKPKPPQLRRCKSFTLV